jgi:DNA-binding MarR family transcriptional regulator
VSDHIKLDRDLSISSLHRPDSPLLGLLLRLLAQHWNQEVDEALAAAGFGDLRRSHANVVPFVPADGIQVRDLADRAGVRKQSMAASVEQLEKAGYVERRPDPSDGRGRLVFLTERGEAVRPVGVAAGRAVEEHWATLIGSERLEDLRGGLIALLNPLRDPADHGGDRAG